MNRLTVMRAAEDLLYHLETAVRLEGKELSSLDVTLQFMEVSSTEACVKVVATCELHVNAQGETVVEEPVVTPTRGHIGDGRF
jgi:hypothetical protein